MITRRRFLGYTAAAPALLATRPLIGATAAETQAAPQVSARARALHRQCLIFDAHVHALDQEFYSGGSFGQRQPLGQWDLPRAKAGGEGAFFCSVFVPEAYLPGRFETKQALRRIDHALREFAANPDRVEMAFNAADVERIHRQGKIAGVLDIEGSYDLDGDLGVLRDLYRLGLRSAQLSAHNWNQHYANSCCAPPGQPGPQGLTAHGRAVIREMNRLGMAINISHASDQAASEAIDVSAAPIIATHHGLRRINDIPRNMPDWLLKKLAAKGGMFCFQIGSDFNFPKAYQWLTAQQKRPFWDTASIADRYRGLDIYQIDQALHHLPAHAMLNQQAALAPTPAAQPAARPARGLPLSVQMHVDDWVAAVDQAIQMVGEDHVGFGSDFNGGPRLAHGMRDVRDLAMITDAMLRRGYSDERIKKFWGGNMLRFFRTVTRG